jgi:phosphoserine aminotransferase
MNANGRIHNFSAGPSPLPLSVLEEARDEMLVYRDLGASIMEVSHRSKQYLEIEASARRSMRELLGIGDEWHVLLLQGGASLQFYQLALNFLGAGKKAGYLVTGQWAENAYAEAGRVGQVYEVASSKASSYDRIPEPDSWQWQPDSSWLHYTSNNTIYGTQFRSEPVVNAPLVCDASSDFLSRPIDMARYGLIYAGAQKNLGPAGVTIVLVHRDFLATRQPGLPTMLDYGTHARDLFNTPPVFAIYLVEKVLRHLLAAGGVPGALERNTRKAQTLYTEIDRTGFWFGTAQPGSRSTMNVCYRIHDPSLEDAFIREAESQGLTGLKGYRTVGGMRASLYNAVTQESVDALVGFMRDFESRKG